MLFGISKKSYDQSSALHETELKHFGQVEGRSFSATLNSTYFLNEKASRVKPTCRTILSIMTTLKKTIELSVKPLAVYYISTIFLLNSRPNMFTLLCISWIAQSTIMSDLSLYMNSYIKPNLLYRTTWFLAQLLTSWCYWQV